MLFKKPNTLKYVDLAIYIDNNAYREGRDDNLIFQYLYHLFYILAVKKCYFKKMEDYDNYAIYGAEEVYKRLINPKQFLPDDDPKKLPKIKSCLNYIKNILYALKVNYQKSQFGEVFCEESTQNSNTEVLEEDMRSKVFSEASSLTSIDTQYYFQKIPGTIRDYLSTLPYASDKAMLRKIYLSCLLTLLSNFTWSNDGKAHVQQRLAKGLEVGSVIDKIYEEGSKDLILWHLDPSMSNYIKTIINNIKNLIKKDLKFIIGYNEPTDQVVESIIASPLVDMLGIPTKGAYEY